MINGFKKKRYLTFSLSFTIFLVLLFLFNWGCKEYDDVSTETGSVLIEASTLKDWVDKDMINNRVVILDVNTDAEAYNGGHIPGAQLVTSGEISETREEGISKVPGMVLSGSKMDSLIQRAAIDEKTTIVFTTSMTSPISPLFPSRTYFTFRYWGFPKNRLKMLNGFNKAWKDAGYKTESSAPVIKASSYSIKKLNSFDPNQRASLNEMISVVKSGSGKPWDARYSSVPTVPSTTGLSVSTKYVVFEGSIKGASFYSYQNLYDTTELKFLSSAALQTNLINAGIDGSSGNTIYPYCRSGVIASVAYFVMDGMLGWKAQLYDGSWGQWGQMSPLSAGQGGVLPDNSPWITDNSTLTSDRIYNIGLIPSGKSVALTANDIETLTMDGFGAENKIESDDAQYAGGGGSSSSTGGSASGGYGR